MAKIRFAIIILVSIGFMARSQEIKLADNSKSKYSIFANTNDHEVLQACKLFQSLFKQVTDCDLSINLSSVDLKKIIFFRLSSYPELKSDDSYIIKTEKNNLIFESRTAKGLQNAVYTFFENYLGCRCYAEDAMYLPKLKTISIKPFSLTENPSFSFRVPYYYEGFNTTYQKWHKLSNAPRIKDRKDWPISNEWGLWVHTMHRLVPPEKYFDTHPEYYALRNGQRIIDQLCLSNPEVLEITISNLKEEISKNPDAKYWSVSQMDNYNFCECEHCLEIDSIEGSNSGSIIRFVNSVAEHFPDKVISTLAYQYSRKAPRVTKPKSNVNIMLCTIECNRSKPIADENSIGGFANDLTGWAAISNNILIWDYIINFSHLVAPFPNFQVLSPNIDLFKANNVGMIFEQGFRGKSGEMNELRCYLISKLLWNSNLDIDSITNDFLNGYYGPAGKFIMDYINLETRELNKSGHSLTLYEPPAVHSKGFLSPENLEKYFEILGRAKQAVAGDSALENRVEMVIQSVRYAWLEVCKSVPGTSGWIFYRNSNGNLVLKERAQKILEEFYLTAKKFGPSILHEMGNSPDDYYTKMNEYFKNGVVHHRAVGKTITFNVPPAPQYSANGSNSLIDGVRGTEAYQMLWQGWQGNDIIATIDLNDALNIDGIEMTFLDDNQSWIMAPKSTVIETSVDNKTYIESARFENQYSGQKINKQIVKFEVPFKSTTKCRYLKISINAIGKMPVWRGVNGFGWTFIDEIVVK